MRRRIASWMAACAGAVGVIALVVACASGPSTREIGRDIVEGRPEEAARKLEGMRDANPKNALLRLQLADVYYQVARAAMIQRDESKYTRYLGLALDEIVTAAELEPASPVPHTWMGILAVYRGDLQGAIRSFQNARNLEPRIGAHYTNLAHTWVYQGKVSRARTLIDRARKLGAPRDEIDRIEVLAAWKSGDMIEAEDIFAQARGNPAFSQTWDGALLPAPMQSFEDFARTCCANPSCGPHMEGACRRLDLEVVTREVDPETVREELRLEMERRRRLREIYDRNRELDIEVEAPEDASETPTAP